jgi:geranylgeranyl pyrophosphate synthase
MIAELAKAIGSTGMVGGQALDLAAEKKSINLDELENIHLCKTGALIVASIKLGMLASTCHDKTVLKALEHFGYAIGLAFQVQDDIIDVESSTEILGKQQGADQKQHKITYPSLLGLEKSKEYLNELYQKALGYLQETKLTDSNLKKLAEFIIRRNH